MSCEFLYDVRKILISSGKYGHISEHTKLFNHLVYCDACREYLEDHHLWDKDWEGDDDEC